MNEDLKDYLLLVYWNLKTSEETVLLNKLKDYGNWSRLEQQYGYQVAKDLVYKFELTLEEIDVLSKVDQRQLYWDNTWDWHPAGVF